MYNEVMLKKLGLGFQKFALKSLVGVLWSIDKIDIAYDPVTQSAKLDFKLDGDDLDDVKKFFAKGAQDTEDVKNSME